MPQGTARRQRVPPLRPAALCILLDCQVPLKHGHSAFCKQKLQGAVGQASAPPGKGQGGRSAMARSHHTGGAPGSSKKLLLAACLLLFGLLCSHTSRASQSLCSSQPSHASSPSARPTRAFGRRERSGKRWEHWRMPAPFRQGSKAGLRVPAARHPLPSLPSQLPEGQRCSSPALAYEQETTHHACGSASSQAGWQGRGEQGRQGEQHRLGPSRCHPAHGHCGGCHRHPCLVAPQV